MWKSTPDQYGRVAIAIHWTSALLIVALLVSGFRADAMADAVGKVTVLRAHAAMGFSILILTLARIAWWRLADRKPLTPEGSSALQSRTAQIVHVLFYVVILGMATSGIGMLALSGAGAILFGGGAGPLPDFETFLPRTPHGIGARLMLALFALHAGAALYHQFIRRDGLLRRMGISL
jgi:cytochrome b561